MVLPEWMREPVELALGDLQQDGAPAPELQWHPEGADAGVLVVTEPANASQRFERDDAVPANVVVGVAEWLQEQLFGAPGLGAEARPVCPGHDHAMRPKFLYDVAWWACPASGSPIHPIGEG